MKFLPDSNTLKTIPTQINTNYTDAPLFWLAEVYLNYAEAAAELDQMGKYTLTQADLDNTINKLRARGQVAPMVLAGPQDPGYTDPAKDADVTSLIWEVRRERRTELMMDGFRFNDLMRWKKGDYMNTTLNPDSFLGAKVPANGSVTRNADGYIMPYTAANKEHLSIRKIIFLQYQLAKYYYIHRISRQTCKTPDGNSFINIQTGSRLASGFVLSSFHYQKQIK